MAESKHIIVVGCGRLGGMLANKLSAEGHQIVVIDSREIAFDKLSIEFSGFKILGDATERNVLLEAKIHQADYLFATTTHDNTNLMVAQVVKTIYNVPRVVARVFDPFREGVYKGFGIETISPTKLAASAFLNVVE
ncbi:TrkA family potassium uptake protein [Anaerolineae bacterium CFX9]|jgi:trk system potassium uptake protein TrkA|nr:TrkA family potassium uptake protein [Oscillatoria laete-virens]MDK3158186.1 TrkA family potassium uptake protein [Kamptonema cortianum]MDL1901260.1 TrkA family potassium uptake protein [Anaerolineae bacterium CFX9]MDL5054946.1 TrkA family potassium uptake protein [Oscillatoria laete-virens NRMC-F 0139]